jgi:tetratricopeptide (TPR) repeat protein
VSRPLHLVAASGRALAALAVVLLAAGAGLGRWWMRQPAPAAAERAVLPPPALEVRRLLEEEVRGGDPLALLELARFQQAAGEPRAALATLEQLARAHPDFARGRHHLGVAYLVLNRAEPARREFLAETRLAPRDVEARVYLGMALQAMGRVPEATAAYRLARQLDPSFPAPYFALAQLDNGPALYPVALRNLQHYLERTSRPAAGYHLMAQIYAHKGERDRGLFYARKAVESEPENGTYWHYLGRVYHEMSGPELLPAATRCYEEAIRRRPEDGSIWFDLGRAYSTGRQWEAAVAAFRRARQTDPGNGEIHYHLGHALQALGRREEASREIALYRLYDDYVRQQRPIQKSLQRRPNDPELKLELAELCLAFRQYAPARQALQEILSARSVPAAIRARARRLVALANEAGARRPPAAGSAPARAAPAAEPPGRPAAGGPPPGDAGRPN